MKNETEKMRELCDQWQTQGISKQAFCNQNGMGYHKFNYWVKKIRRKNVAPAAPARGFSRIPVQQPDVIEENQQTLAAITFPSGARIELFGSLDALFSILLQKHPGHKQRQAEKTANNHQCLF